ncbi:hypothetical protein PV734_37080 [Streptomyces sp. AK08-02]|nr:hypothetical protein [Streptomyces sp. AK08-02]MDX3752179.1 hypothetical protein [Streptomyces sp. AK08-02]
MQNLDSYLNHDAANHGQNADGIAIKFGSGSGNRITGPPLHQCGRRQRLQAGRGDASVAHVVNNNEA